MALWPALLTTVPRLGWPSGSPWYGKMSQCRGWLMLNGIGVDIIDL